MDAEQRATIKVLLAEDVASDAELVQREVSKADLTVIWRAVKTRESFIDALETFQPDIVLSDYRLVDFDGRDVIGIVRRRDPDLPIIIVTGVLSDETAVQLIQAGASDYVRKDRLARLPFAVIHALATVKERRDRRRAEDVVRRQADLYAAMLATAADGFCLLDAAGRLLEVSDAYCRMSGYSRDELLDHRIHDLVADPNAELVAARLQKAMEAVYDRFESLHRCKSGEVLDVDISLSYWREGDRFLLFARDITERKEAERRQRVMRDELNHRVKNTLATVLAISEQTFSTALSSEAFPAAFEGRLLALSRTHNLLNRSFWTSVGLREVVEQALSPYADSDRIQIAGEDVGLGPVAAVTLGMAFHEMATNAAKYGALLVPAGHVRVSWRTVPPARLHLEWREEGGPPVQPPRRQGFGTRLIEGMLAMELCGEARLDFPPQGMCCTLDMAMEQISTH